MSTVCLQTVSSDEILSDEDALGKSILSSVNRSTIFFSNIDRYIGERVEECIVVN